MARAGDVIENPVRGERVVFRRTAADTGGELLEFDFFMKPGVPPVFEHVHPRQEERIEVVSGTVSYRLRGAEHRLDTGEIAVLPPGVRHTLWNPGVEEAHVIVEARPALTLETVFETLFGLARDGKTNKRGTPNPLQAAVIGLESETFFPWPPIFVQRGLLAVLVPVLKLLGYRGRYPQYSKSD
ncbi:MAG: cupin domain-containing protein [Chloroflexota bacterium]|nr:cupin domain-containing protein [Chloroflexota bacterium]